MASVPDGADFTDEKLADLTDSELVDLHRTLLAEIERLRRDFGGSPMWAESVLRAQLLETLRPSGEFWLDGSMGDSECQRPCPRRPAVIGFEQLEGREMMSAGVSLTITPDPSRPSMNMPRPYVGTFNPETTTASRVTMTPRAVDGERIGPCSPWARFRRRGLEGG